MPGQFVRDRAGPARSIRASESLSTFIIYHLSIPNIQYSIITPNPLFPIHYPAATSHHFDLPLGILCSLERIPSRGTMARKAAASDNHASSQSQSQSQSQTMRLLSEEEVLQPAPWGISTDDWPIYLLKDAVVYSKDGKTPANLLHAELEGPFSIHGKLEVDKEHNHLRKQSGRMYITIAIN